MSSETITCPIEPHMLQPILFEFDGICDRDKDKTNHLYDTNGGISSMLGTRLEIQQLCGISRQLI